MSKVIHLHRASQGAPTTENGKVPPRKIRNKTVPSREGLLLNAFNPLDPEVRDACWEGANIYGMNGTDLSRNSFGTSMLLDVFACFMPGCL
jgi:hypothetical protein